MLSLKRNLTNLLSRFAPGFPRSRDAEDSDSRLDAVPQPATQANDTLGSFIEEAEAAIADGEEPEYFYKRIDSLMVAAYRSFLAAYASEKYAKILALKVTNLAVAKYNYSLRHTKLAAGPIQLMIDPANNCPLACPACVHTKNPAMKPRFDWPGGLLSMDVYDRFIEIYGPTAFGAVFFNYGEPFLNKKTPQMIAKANGNLLRTSVSSNLNVPVDAESVVHSGLDSLIASIDGATQTTYARYRRGGNIEKCFDNIRNLVAARKRLGRSNPWIEWQFLTFEHNEHEVDLALEIAESLGVDEVKVATPFAVDEDDPEIQTIESPLRGRHVLSPPARSRWSAPEPDGISDHVEERFAVPWTQIARARGALENARPSESPTCSWLYQSVTIDALGRIMPCCMPPEKTLNRTYGVFPDDQADPSNARMMVQSRESFADRANFDAAVENGEIEKVPYCSICHENPEPTYDVARDARRDFRLMDYQGVVSDTAIHRLTHWADGGRSLGGPRHRDAF